VEILKFKGFLKGEIMEDREKDDKEPGFRE